MRVNRPCRSDSVISEYFIEESEQGIVGCAAVRKQDNRGYLYGLAVDKSWRRKGIGHTLTQKRLDWLGAQGVALAFVMSMFWNVRFFKKHGFSLTNKATTAELKGLHNDFSDNWSSRSALLVVDLSSSVLGVSGTRGKNEHQNVGP
jgi:N-acetylglutamate synthase-like GNAT family acetyltransferase